MYTVPTMSERPDKRKSNHNVVRRFWPHAAVVAATAGALAIAPTLIHDAEKATTSKIVAGVPGQVSEHLTTTPCISRVGAICSVYTTDYFLGIEQCPQDIQAAREGRQTESFSPSIDSHSKNCVYDTVSVSQDTYQQYPDGSVIIFDGPVGKRLQE